MGGIQGVGFDLDGTLYANYKLNIRLIPFVFRHWALLSAFGKARGSLHRMTSARIEGRGDFYDVQAALVAGQCKLDPGQVKEKIFRLIYRGWEEHFARIKPFPHVKETLALLKARGIRLGLLSDFPPRRKLELLGLDGLFDAVFSTEEFCALKPDPRPFEKLASSMGLSPGEILYVGNSPGYDIRGAKRAGMKAALIRRGILSTGFSRGKGGDRAEFIFRNYRQLLRYVVG
ncbi:MAG: HAD family hydrolase [Treponema sp.]|jgi:putative hydrolase of the HAD superfamily|nr:HAD family hydrolase [Treponema sp.]